MVFCIIFLCCLVFFDKIYMTISIYEILVGIPRNDVVIFYDKRKGC